MLIMCQIMGGFLFYWLKFISVIYYPFFFILFPLHQPNSVFSCISFSFSIRVNGKKMQPFPRWTYPVSYSSLLFTPFYCELDPEVQSLINHPSPSFFSLVSIFFFLFLSPSLPYYLFIIMSKFSLLSSLFITGLYGSMMVLVLAILEDMTTSSIMTS